MSQYLPQHPESSPTQAPDRQPDEQIKDQKENSEGNGEENSSPQVHAHTLTGDVFQASPQQLADWQHTNPTLSKIQEMASGKEQAPGRAQFCYQNGLLYRKWSLDGSSKQLVLPKQCWSAVL